MYKVKKTLFVSMMTFCSIIQGAPPFPPGDLGGSGVFDFAPNNVTSISKNSYSTGTSNLYFRCGNIACHSNNRSSNDHKLCSLYCGLPLPVDSLIGTAKYDYFEEKLPQDSKGIYTICTPNNAARYVGSTNDLNSRLCEHYNNGVLVPGDKIEAIIFKKDARQKDVLDLERFLIQKLAPILNKHKGTPGRPWEAEQVSKLQAFAAHNKHLLTPYGLEITTILLEGKKIQKENYKMGRSLLRIMRLFR